MDKKRIFCIFFLLCSLATGVFAEGKWAYLNRRHETRIGWGDQMFESLIWHNPLYYVRTMPESYRRVYQENYHHNQHIWFEYQYRHKGWFSFGAMVDISFVDWDDVTRNGRGVVVSKDKNHYFYNLVIMPTIRFTYYHHEYVNIYSGLGFGMCINGGTEKNGKGNKTDVGAAVNFTVLGFGFNYDRWVWAVDFGGLSALRDINTIFMLSSRMINVSFGARF